MINQEKLDQVQEDGMTIRERLSHILPELDARYGTDLHTYLEFDREKPWQLLFSTILSAQCTDATLNPLRRRTLRRWKRISTPRAFTTIRQRA